MARAPWGGRTYVADTSAWARARSVKAAWADALRRGQIATCEMVAFELLFSARDGDEFDDRAASLDRLVQAPVTADVLLRAREACRELAHGHALFHRSVSVADVIIAAAASTAGIGVLHYDADYDTLATVLSFESRWIAPRGSLD